MANNGAPAQTIHADIQAEQNVVAAAVYDLDGAGWPVFSKALDYTDFHKTAHQVIWRACRIVFDRDGSIDPIRLRAELTASNEHEAAGGDAYLAEIGEVTQKLVPAIVEKHARIVARLSQERRGLVAVEQARQRLEAGDIEQAAAALEVIGEARKADDAHHLVSLSELLAMPDTPIPWIIQPILARGCLTLLQGRPKGGKSCLAQMLGLVSAYGSWPESQWCPDHPYPVLYCSWEDGLQRIKRRARQYMAGLSREAPPASIWYAYRPEYRFDQPATLKTLAQEVQEKRIKLLVLDVLKYCHNSEENSASEMQPVMGAICEFATEHDLAVLIVHHTRKPQGMETAETSERSRGSSTIAAACDTILDFGARVQANTTAVRIESKEAGSSELRISYEDDGPAVRWRILSDAQAATSCDLQSRAYDALTRLVAEHPPGVSRRQLQEATAMPVITARRVLDALLDQGLIHSVPGPRNSNLYLLGSANS